MKIRKNDIVTIISGNFKGKKSKVVKVLNNKVQLENIGFYKKHVKPQTHKKNAKGGIIERLSFIDISNIALFSKDTKKINNKIKI